MEIIYWAVLIIWIIVIKVQKKDSGVSLKIAFVLFVLASILTILNLRNLAEPVMRVSFIGWIIGIVHALVEYKKAK